jgi:hypothetical protein
MAPSAEAMPRSKSNATMRLSSSFARERELIIVEAEIRPPERRILVELIDP